MRRLEEIEKKIIERGYTGYEEHLLSEVKRLREGIEKHRDKAKQYFKGDGFSFDKNLWKLLEDI